MSRASDGQSRRIPLMLLTRLRENGRESLSDVEMELLRDAVILDPELEVFTGEDIGEIFADVQLTEEERRSIALSGERIDAYIRGAAAARKK